MQISAKADYAVRAAIELAAAGENLVKADDIARAQGIPATFLVKILHELRMAGLVRSHRGPDGGHHLTRTADAISVADILRAIEGPLAEVRGTAPEALSYPGHAAPLQRVWVALRANIETVLESVTLEDLARGSLPAGVDALADEGESPVPL
jgi:Rrf2 family protein